MSDVLATLPPFEWREQRYPVLARSVSFAHESVQHKLQYRNGELIEQTGARNLTFSYTLALRTGIAKGPYRDLFTVGLPRLLADCRNREAGNLKDPIYGEFACVPVSFTDESDPGRRDGTDIKVEFLHSPEETDDEQFADAPSPQGLTSEAGALEQELSLIDWEQEPSPEGTTDTLSAVSGLFGQIDRNGEKIVAAMNDFAYRCEKVENSLDRLENPEHWHARQAVRRNRLAAKDIGDRAARPDRSIRRVLVRTKRTIQSVALELNITTQELLAANPFLARLPFVPANTQVQAPADGRRAQPNA